MRYPSQPRAGKSRPLVRILLVGSAGAVLLLGGVFLLGRRGGSAGITGEGESRETDGAQGAVEVDAAGIESLWAEGRFGAVMEVVDASLAERPLDFAWLRLAGLASFSDGITEPDEFAARRNLERARTELARALVVAPEEARPELHYYLGKALFHLGYFHLDEALRHFALAREQGLNPIPADLPEYEGLVLAGLGRHAQAALAFNEALAVEDRAALRLALARAYSEAGQAADARTQAELVIGGNDPQLAREARYLLATDLREAGDLEGAAEVYEEIVSIDESQADAWHALGEIALERGDRAQARSFWRRALSQDPGHTPSLMRLGNSG